MNLCEIKPYIDDSVYINIQNAKFRVMNELKPSLIFRKYSAEKIKSINQDFMRISNQISQKIEELNSYAETFV